MKVFLIVLTFVLLFFSCTQKQIDDPPFNMTGTLTDVKSGEALLYSWDIEKKQTDTIAYSKIENSSFVFDSARKEFNGPVAFTLLIKPTNEDPRKATRYTKKPVILENMPLTGRFGMFDGVSMVPESKYHDLVINLESRSPELKILFDSLNLTTNKYIKLSNEKAEKEILMASYKKLARISENYSTQKAKVVSTLLNESEDTIYLGLLLDTYGSYIDPSDFISHANNILPGLDHTSLTYKNINKLKNDYEQEMKLAIGKRFIDFSLKSLDGSTIDLSKTINKNEYTLLDFWASWCAPCRNEIPKMKIAYDEFNSKGFEIFMVSIDTKKENWEKASEEENFIWVNTFDDKRTQDLYVVKTIPQNFLISKNGEIVGVNLRGEELKTKLEELLN